MLALLGLITILGLLAAILSKKISPLVALVAFPVAASLFAGFGLRTGRFMIDGIQGISGVIGMFVFAILFFGVMTDARMLEPIIERLLRWIGSRPSRIVPGSALLALLVHLDGSGAVCFLVTIPALLPLYKRVGIDRRILACVASLAAGVNFLPWTGPTLRASAALHISTTSIFTPLIGVQIVGLVFVFATSWLLGMSEERRLGREHLEKIHREDSHDGREQGRAERDQSGLPRFFYLNLALTAIVLGVMVSDKVDPAIIFMLGTVVALTLNFPSLKSQQARLAGHAPAAILMASILFAAGSFTGIMKGTGMLNAMAGAAVHHLPLHGVKYMPLGARFDRDATEPAVRPRFVLLRSIARSRECGGSLWNCTRDDGAGVAARHAYDRIPGKSDDAGDLSGSGLVRDQSGAAPALFDSLPVSRFAGHDTGRGCLQDHSAMSRARLARKSFLARAGSILSRPASIRSCARQALRRRACPSLVRCMA